MHIPLPSQYVDDTTSPLKSTVTLANQTVSGEYVEGQVLVNTTVKVTAVCREGLTDKDAQVMFGGPVLPILLFCDYLFICSSINVIMYLFI